MSAAQAIGLMKYNALRCARSKGPYCRCRCGGAYHGHEHPGVWLENQAQLIRVEVDAERRQREPIFPEVEQ